MKSISISNIDRSQFGFTPSNLRRKTGVRSNLMGFTLLEMTIAMGIFVILSVLTLGIYSYALRAEIRTSQMSELQAETQLIMEIMTKRVRNSKVYYNWYPSQTLDMVEDELALMDQSSNLIVFKLKDSSVAVCTVGNCSLDDDFVSIPAANITVSDLRFFVTPATNPFSLSDPPAEFPKVTIVIDLENTRGNITHNLTVQQTIPQRLGGF